MSPAWSAALLLFRGRRGSLTVPVWAARSSRGSPGADFQACPDRHKRLALAWAQDASGSDGEAPLGQHVLQEAADALVSGPRQVLPCVPPALLEADGDVSSLTRFNAVVGEGHPTDGRGEGGEDLCAGSGRFTRRHPGFVPDGGRHVMAQSSGGQCLLALATEELGEGSHRKPPVFLAGREPLCAIR